MSAERTVAMHTLPGWWWRFLLLLGVTYAAAPLAGLGYALAFEYISLGDIRHTVYSGICAVVLLGAWIGTLVYFRNFLRPVFAWLKKADRPEIAPDHLHQRVGSFGRHFWGLHFLLALSVPFLCMSLTRGVLHGSDAADFAHLFLVHLVAAIFVGLPAYLAAIDRLGHLSSELGLNGVQVSLKSRMILLVGMLPLLSYTVLMNYYWIHTRELSLDLVMICVLLGVVTAAVTLLSTRSVAQSLRPVQDVLSRSGATTRDVLSRLRPQSSDEIGYLTQTLGRLFGRLNDQESHMRAVVETAAEGIIVVDAEGNIDTFNSAAEQVFGYLALEIRGRPITRLLPDLVGESGVPRVTRGEEEVIGLHRNGQEIALSVRTSEVEISGRCMFTLLVADITKRKTAEDQLRSAEARYRDLVETAHDLVWSADPEGRWTYLNKACKAIYGYEPGELLGHEIGELVAPDHADKAAEAFAIIRRGDELVQYETVHVDSAGNPHHLSFNAKAHLDSAGNVIHISGTARDITDQKLFQSRLTYQAEHDSLTGLFNRHYFHQELERTVARVARNGSHCAVLYIDLDQFKYINDTLGHAAGDSLLVEISELIGGHVREGDLFARFGGDEFTLLLYNIVADDVCSVAEHFRTLVEGYKFLYDKTPFNVTASIGIALLDQQVSSADEVMSHADIACNMAKRRGRNCTNIYNPADRDKAGMAEDMGWAARVREMLEQDRFKLVYQPIAAVSGGQVQDYEVLVRMVCEDGDIIMPGGFMPAAERFGLIHSVDRWIVERAMRQLAETRRLGNDIRFSINLSGKAFEDETLLPLVKSLLKETGLDPSWLTFEITETAAIANLSAATRFIRSLKDIGCQFALDDFGSGFCSFTYLKHLPVDKLKIDGSFVQGMASANVDQAMVESMNQVAHALGKQTIAEYVEDEKTLEMLRDYGVDFAQGNYIGKPRDVLVNIARPIARVVDFNNAS